LFPLLYESLWDLHEFYISLSCSYNLSSCTRFFKFNVETTLVILGAQSFFSMDSWPYSWTFVLYPDLGSPAVVMATGAGGVSEIYFRVIIYNLSEIVTIYMPRVPWRAIEDSRRTICERDDNNCDAINYPFHHLVGRLLVLLINYLSS